MYFIQPRSNTSSRTNSRSNSRSDSYKSSPHSSRSNSYNTNVSPRSEAYHSNAYHHANEYHHGHEPHTSRSNTFPLRSRPRTRSYDSNHSLDSSFSVPSICHDRYRDSYLPPTPTPPPLYEHHHQPIPTGLMMRYKIAKVFRLIPERRRGGKQTTVLRPQEPYEQPYARREAWRSRGW